MTTIKKMKAPLKEYGFHGVDLTGFVSGRLTITSLVGLKVYPSGSQVYVWCADCSCGLHGIHVNGQHFIRGAIKSCGCLAKEVSAKVKRGNHIRTGPGDRSYLAPVRLSTEDIFARGRDFRDFRGVHGSLTVESLAYGTLYWTKKQVSLEKRLVTHWNCLCSCGARTIRSSSYLYKKGARLACHKCIRNNERVQPEVTT